jgi:hypothetical protein
MTERDGFGDEGQRPSGRGAVTERVVRQERGVREIDLTDEATAPEDGADPAEERDHDQTDRESSGAFEPAPATQPGSSSIFDVDERAKQEDLNRTGYEPPMADTEADGERSEEPRAEATEITPTPVPTADPPAEDTGPPGLPEPATATAPADEAPAEEAPAAEVAPAADAGTALLGSLDVADIRNRFLDIQAGFVDEPWQAVEEAGRFVDDLVRQVADALQAQRGQLGESEGSTEDLRLALRAYRQFVDRLLGLAS